MKENANPEKAPVYCPICKTEWPPNTSSCLGCGVKKAQRESQNSDDNPQKTSHAKKQSGANTELNIEYTEEIMVHGKFTIRMRRPILTAKERAKREQQIINTLTAIARSGGSFIKSKPE